MARKMKTMDGNNAAAWVSYAFTEVAGCINYKAFSKSSLISYTLNDCF